MTECKDCKHCKIKVATKLDSKRFDPPQEIDGGMMVLETIETKRYELFCDLSLSMKTYNATTQKCRNYKKRFFRLRV